MRKVNFLYILLLLTFSLSTSLKAQDIEFVRGDCMPDLASDVTSGSTFKPGKGARLPRPLSEWDPAKTYHQLVILVEFSDTKFKREEPLAAYNSIFNEKGYNEGEGIGCVSDYFSDQSEATFNLKFDIYGPYPTSGKAQPYANPTNNTRNYGKDAFAEAINKFLEEHPDIDFHQYDWNNDGYVNQVIFVCAGRCGNQGTTSYGYLWPNTSSIPSITTPDNLIITNYSSSAELWNGSKSCGIGTICHEFSHSLGLPDIYPTGTGSSFYSVCDEWDLMDGGNFTNLGWCPPNLTAQEKMFLGWLTPIELSEPTTITEMEPISKGGNTYIIHHTTNEYLLLENRQRVGWDYGIPGKGLVISHVDFNANKWANNSVNSVDSHFLYDIVHADNLNYEQWNVIQPRTSNQWEISDKALYNKHLSTSPYPWTPDTTSFENRALTDNSVPATKMFNANTQGSKLLSKPITNIQMTDNGLISFDFMGGSTTGIQIKERMNTNATAVYGLNGIRQSSVGRRGLFIIRKADGTIQKVLK